MERRTVSTSVSSDVIEYLLERGMSLSDIAANLCVTKSFISRVRSRQRSLTLDHLAALERVMGKPLPLLLMEATPKEDIPPDLLPLYEATKSVLRSSMRLRKELSVRSPRRRTKAVATSRKRTG
jgi:transcriptional regulator with XRE-family HTH domain